jgi:hypothetical protein
MIDILQESPDGLRLAAKFLTDHAALKEAVEHGLNLTQVPAGTQTPDAPPPPPPAPPLVPAAPPRDPRDSAFRGHSDASPPAPVAPPAPPAAPGVSTSSAPASTATTITGTLPTDDCDDAGMPHDLRIHQKGKGKKKDGTWKLQKGIDPALVSAVTQELNAQGRIRKPATASTVPAVTPLPVGASAPVSLPPPPPPPGSAFAPQAPQGGEAQGQTQSAQAPPPPPQASVTLPPSAPMHVPPPPTVGMPDSPQPPVLPGEVKSPFRALVDKITIARREGKLTPDEVTHCVTQAGAPNLQLLSSLAHLVPVVDASIDAILAMR